MALSDKRLEPEEKTQLRMFREHNSITTEEHRMCMAEVGWTTQEYEDGVKAGGHRAEFGKRLAKWLHW